jgi:hypothetical protein
MCDYWKRYGQNIKRWRWVKDQQMHQSFNVLVLNTFLHVSAFQTAIIRESDMNMLRLCPKTWKAEKDGSCILWQTAWRSWSYPDHHAVCHNIQRLSFSASHDIGHNLSIFICDSLMMAFRNAETCRRILSTNTLNDWCICWPFTHLKKMHCPKCKMKQ